MVVYVYNTASQLGCDAVSPDYVDASEYGVLTVTGVNSTGYVAMHCVMHGVQYTNVNQHQLLTGTGCTVQQSHSHNR